MSKSFKHSRIKVTLGSWMGLELCKGRERCQLGNHHFHLSLKQAVFGLQMYVHRSKASFNPVLPKKSQHILVRTFIFLSYFIVTSISCQNFATSHSKARLLCYLQNKFGHAIKQSSFGYVGSDPLRVVSMPLYGPRV